VTGIIIAAAIGAVATILSAVILHSVNQVKISVNHRLDEWIEQTTGTIQDLKTQRDQLHDERPQ
jgi:hypothetical protein